jgi:hypothetical protein
VTVFEPASRLEVQGRLGPFLALVRNHKGRSVAVCGSVARGEPTNATSTSWWSSIHQARCWI